MTGEKASFIAEILAQVILRLLILGVVVSGSKPLLKRDMSQMMPSRETSADPPNFNFAVDGVVELSDKNFQTEVLRSNFMWLVDFDWPGPACPWCQEFAEIVKNIALGLKGTPTRVGVVNCRSAGGKQLSNRFGITMYPSIYIFGKDKSHPVEYKGSKSVEELMETVLHENTKPYPASGPCGSDSKEDPKTDVYELTDYNFEEVVMLCDSGMWLVNFYSAWAKLCIKFFPVFQKAATELKGRAKFGAYDMSSNSQFSQKYNVTKVCTVKMFPIGSKQGINPIDYNKGLHGIQFDTNLVPWVKDQLKDTVSAEEVRELTSFNVLESTCKGKAGRSCIILVIPEASKCAVTCIRENLGLLTRLSEKYKTENWGWLWISAGTELEFEKKFGLSKLPTSIALDLSNKVYTTTSGFLTESKLQEFLQFFSDGRLPLKPISPGTFPNGMVSLDYNKVQDGGYYQTNSGSRVKDGLKDSVSTEEIRELTSFNALESTCKGEVGRACIVLVMPEASKCSATCRKENLGLLTRLSEKYKTENWGWLWISAGTELEFEKKFGLSKLPAAVVVDLVNKEYTTASGQLTERSLQEFLKVFSDGKSPFKPIPALNFPSERLPTDNNKGLEGVQYETDSGSRVKEHSTNSVTTEEVRELTSFNVLESNCKGEIGRACIILVIPEASKCAVTCRKENLKLLARLSEKYKTENWGWLWISAGTEFEFEKKFGLYKLPAAVVVDLVNKEYTTASGLLTERSLQEFLKIYSEGKAPFKPIPASYFPSERSPTDYSKGQQGVQFETGLGPRVQELSTDSVTTEEVRELTSFNVLESTCKGKVGRACIILVIPEASKCADTCMRENLGLLTRLSEKYKTENWGWLLISAGSEIQFEKQFGLSKLPAVVALDLSNKVYTATSGLLTESKLLEFLQNFSDERLPLKPTPALYFPIGRMPTDYNKGQHKVQYETTWGTQIKAVEIRELTSYNTFELMCNGKVSRACIILVIPEASKCAVTCRKENLGLLTRLSEKYKTENWGWLWISAGSEFEFEKQFGLPKLPAVIVLDMSNKVYTATSEPLTERSFQEILQIFSDGRLPQKPTPPLHFPNGMLPSDYNKGQHKVQYETIWVTQTKEVEIREVTSFNVLESACKGGVGRACIILVIPEASKCGLVCTKENIGLLIRVSEKYKTENWGWLWISAGTELEFEKKFGLYKLPTAVAVDLVNKEYTTASGLLTQRSLQEFLKNFSDGSLTMKPIPASAFPREYQGQASILPREHQRQMQGCSSGC